jgi:hypothetical protein
MSEQVQSFRSRTKMYPGEELVVHNGSGRRVELSTILSTEKDMSCKDRDIVRAMVRVYP